VQSLAAGRRFEAPDGQHRFHIERCARNFGRRGSTFAFTCDIGVDPV
jgi:hypothetical protein